MSRRRSRRGKNQQISWGWLAWLALLVVLLYIYFSPSIGKPHGTTRTVQKTNLLQQDQPPILSGTAGWDYHQSLQADLDQDGKTESVEIIARVANAAQKGEYLWDDGQPWQVYIKDGDQITHIYNRFVQLGGLSVMITDEQPPRVAIAENQGAGFALYTVTYSDNAKVKVEQLANLPVKSKTW
jgi:hypothetical protein